MPQMNWTYVADTGQHYKVNLYHGSRSGHLLVTVNNQISIIDFFVKGDKSYTLMLEDEVFTLEIEQTKDGYQYGLTMDTRTKTDKNLRRSAAERRQNWWIAILASVTVAALVVFLWWFSGYQDQKLLDRSLPFLAETGLKTIGRVGQDPAGGWIVHYTSGKQGFKLADSNVPAGLAPIEHGDDVQVAFLPRKPQIAMVQWEQAGPRRSLRLFTAWRRSLSLTAELAPLSQCALAIIEADAALLMHSGAPWHLQGDQDFMQWLGQQETLLAQIHYQCDPRKGKNDASQE
jgi:hypothetical protein